MTTLCSRRSALSLATLTAVVPVLAACSSGSNGGATASGAASLQTTSTGSSAPTGSVPTGFPEGMGSGQGDDVFPRTVVHVQGSTEITAAPTKVVVTATGQIDAVVTLGLVPVGSTAGDGAEAVPDYLVTAFPEHAEALGAVADVGKRSDPSVEAIANLSPDLILMNSAGKDAQALYDALSAIAPTVVTQGTGQYWKQDFLLLADAIGKPETAQTWMDDFHADAASAGEGIDDATTVSLLRKNGDRTRIFGAVSFAGSVLADMGVARPANQQFTDDVSVDISAEQLDQADGDWILYGVQGGDASELTSMDLWPALPAVTADRAIQVDDDPFYLNAGPTAARTVLTKVSEIIKM